MPRLRNFIAVVFALTLWFGATQHCNLEAAGILAPHEESTNGGCPISADVCHGDGCGLVESGAYRASDSDASIQAPVLAVCGCLLCVSLVCAPSGDVLTDSVSAPIDRVQPWVSNWHFDRRTVAAPGAPSFVGA